MTDYAATSAWQELLAGLGELDQTFLTGPKAVGDEQSVAEGYRFLATALGIALDTYLYADRARPSFVDVNTPFRRDRRWGGDNTDAWYCLAPIDPTRTYRVTGDPGDSTYFSLTVYNEPSPGEWSNRVVGIVNDTDLALDDDGRFSFLLGPSRPADYDGVFVELSDDASVAFTRDYQVDPHTGRRVMWDITCLDGPGPLRRTDAETAQAFRTALAWVRTMFAIVPLTVAPRVDETSLGHEVPQRANEFAEPYQVQDMNFGWSARDACYGFASFVLEPGEALVITHTPPACRFWNVIVWNQFMAGQNAGDARTSLNLGTAVPNEDGSVTVVVAREQLDLPNAITTVDHAQGMIAFRWFLVDEVPARPTCELVRVEDL
jgi:hypothetical protein